LEELQYPVGKFHFEGPATEQQVREWIEEIAATPGNLKKAVAGLTDEQLDTPYRPGGWTVRQVVHHVPDSHMNSYVRFHLALTEAEPAVKGYDERLWAEVEDAKSAPVDLSLELLEALHRRWVLFLRNLSPADLKKTFRHSEMGLVPLEKNIALYAWHGRHHVAHITSLRRRNGWN
jgi:uncharacterized damage-inducible protein DinB